MQQNNAKAITGLSIAVVVLAGITFLGCVIGWLFVTIGGSYFNAYGPDLIQNSSSYDYLYQDDYGRLLTDSDIMDLGNLGLMLGAGVLLWEAAMSLVSLVAGILGIRNAKNPQKLGIVFGWSIAGAVCTLLSGRFITMVLQIIVAVLSYRDKNAALAPAMAYGQQPFVSAQPYAAPQNSYAPQQATPMYGSVQPAPQSQMQSQVGVQPQPMVAQPQPQPQPIGSAQVADAAVPGRDAAAEEAPAVESAPVCESAVQSEVAAGSPDAVEGK